MPIGRCCFQWKPTIKGNFLLKYVVYPQRLITTIESPKWLLMWHCGPCLVIDERDGALHSWILGPLELKHSLQEGGTWNSGGKQTSTHLRKLKLVRFMWTPPYHNRRRKRLLERRIWPGGLPGGDSQTCQAACKLWREDQSSSVLVTSVGVGFSMMQLLWSHPCSRK